MEAYLRSYRLLSCQVGLVVLGVVRGVLYMDHLTCMHNLSLVEVLVAVPPIHEQVHLTAGVMYLVPHLLHPYPLLSIMPPPITTTI